MSKKLFSVILAIMSVLLISISLFLLLSPKKEYLTTTGTIVDIVERMDVSTDSIDNKAIIDYTVDGIDYKDVEYGAYNSSMKIGDEVLVYYEADNPSHIQAKGFEKVPYVILIVSTVALVASIILLIKENRACASDNR